MGQQSRRTLLWSMMGYPYDRCFILGHFFELMQNKLYFFTKKGEEWRAFFSGGGFPLHYT